MDLDSFCPFCFTGNSLKGLMKEVRVGLSDANAEEAASIGMACRREGRVAFIESPMLCRGCYRPSEGIKSRQPPPPVYPSLCCRRSPYRTIHFADKIIGNKLTGAPCPLSRIAAAS